MSSNRGIIFKSVVFVTSRLLKFALYYIGDKKMSLAFVSTKRVREHVRKRGVYFDDLMYAIQNFFLARNYADEIKYVRFVLRDEVEPDKIIRRSLVVNVCADALSDEIKNELEKMLTDKFPTLHVFVRLSCEE